MCGASLIGCDSLFVCIRGIGSTPPGAGPRKYIPFILLILSFSFRFISEQSKKLGQDEQD
jgi:hypothetical protein